MNKNKLGKTTLLKFMQQIVTLTENRVIHSNRELTDNNKTTKLKTKNMHFIM